MEAKVGDLVELFMGRGQVRAIREEDGMLEVWAMGWEMAGEQRPRYFVQRDAVKVVKTVYYQMPGTNQVTSVGVSRALFPAAAAAAPYYDRKSLVGW